MYDYNHFDLEDMDGTTVKLETRPDLSAKLERLKRGLVTDTIRVSAPLYPNLKDSQFNYALKRGRLGGYDPLRKRTKLFRSAVSRFAPPYYFWHKEFINSMRLKPVLEVNAPILHISDDIVMGPDMVSCIWCQLPVPENDYKSHRTDRCKRRFTFLGNGYYRCGSCNEGFLVEQEMRKHSSLHFPNKKFEEIPEKPIMTEIMTEIKTEIKTEIDMTKNHQVICRDQAKRRKWL